MHASLTPLTAPSGALGSTRIAPRFPFLPRAAVSPRTLVWSALLGIALVTPAMLLSSAFPVSGHGRAAFASLTLAPAIGFLKHDLLGPALEEIVYRGLVLQLGRRYLALGFALAFMASVFGATHFPGGPVLMGISGLTALLLGWIAVRTRSLYASFVCHAAFNFSAGFITAPTFNIAEKLQAVPPGARIANPMTTLFPAWWIVLCGAIVTLAVVMLLREFRRPAVPARAE